MSDMMSLTPGDLITKLKVRAAQCYACEICLARTDEGHAARTRRLHQFLFITVMSLFGAMVFGAFLGTRCQIDYTREQLARAAAHPTPLALRSLFQVTIWTRARRCRSFAT
jgi:nitric oxide reductase large subunit